MIMGKRQIVLASLVLVLGVAIYLNWQFSGGTTDLTKQVNGETSQGRNYGEAQLANGEASEEHSTVQTAGDGENDLFTQTKLERKKTREESLSNIKKVLSDSGAGEEATAQALEKAQKLIEITDQEMQMETTIEAKGFSKCIVFINGDKVNVLVRCDGLSGEQVAQIRDIVIGQTKISAQNLSINEVKA